MTKITRTRFTEGRALALYADHQLLTPSLNYKQLAEKHGIAANTAANWIRRVAGDRDLRSKAEDEILDRINQSTPERKAAEEKQLDLPTPKPPSNFPDIIDPGKHVEDEYSAWLSMGTAAFMLRLVRELKEGGSL